MLNKFNEIKFTDLELYNYRSANPNPIIIDSISYSNSNSELKIKYRNKEETFKISSSRELKKLIKESLFSDDTNDDSSVIYGLLDHISEYMNKKDKRIVNVGDALLSNFIFEYKKTRNYTLLTEDDKLTDDEIFGGLIYGAGRADVYSAWELFFNTKKLDLEK